jgi:hypothetical protein
VRAGHDTHGPSGYYRVLGLGQSLLDQLDRALANGLAFVCGFRVDEAFTLDDGPEFIEPFAGRLVGGHAVEILGRVFKDGSRWYQVKNSWGVSWRAGGYAFLHERILTEAFDHTVMAP